MSFTFEKERFLRNLLTSQNLHFMNLHVFNKIIISFTILSLLKCREVIFTYLMKYINYYYI